MKTTPKDTTARIRILVSSDHTHKILIALGLAAALPILAWRAPEALAGLGGLSGLAGIVKYLRRD